MSSTLDGGNYKRVPIGKRCPAGMRRSPKNKSLCIGTRKIIRVHKGLEQKIQVLEKKIDDLLQRGSSVTNNYYGGSQHSGLSSTGATSSAYTGSSSASIGPTTIPIGFTANVPVNVTTAPMSNGYQELKMEIESLREFNQMLMKKHANDIKNMQEELLNKVHLALLQATKERNIVFNAFEQRLNQSYQQYTAKPQYAERPQYTERPAMAQYTSESRSSVPRYTEMPKTSAQTIPRPSNMSISIQTSPAEQNIISRSLSPRNNEIVVYKAAASPQRPQRKIPSAISSIDSSMSSRSPTTGSPSKTPLSEKLTTASAESIKSEEKCTWLDILYEKNK